MYHGIRVGAGTYNHPMERRVHIRDGDSIELLRHFVRHSPTGFEWGYGGSGPADLARSLLIDAVGQGEGYDEVVDRLYQDFKFDVVANLPDSWTIPARLVVAWVLVRMADHSFLKGYLDEVTEPTVW